MSHRIKVDEKTGIAYITLVNGDLSATFLNFGARWHDFITPDKDGNKENILLSLDTPESILADNAQFGALVGPVAGRIKNAEWNGIPLEKNFHEEHHIHGGSHGWWCQFWDYEMISDTKVAFTLVDTKSGYPGPITVANTYELTATAVVMTTKVTSESQTIVNPTNHVYFNLSGNAKRNITAHNLLVKSNGILETDNINLPTGKVLPVDNTGYDFRETTSLADNLAKLTSGIDDAFILESSHPQICLTETKSGRKLNISSNREAAVIFSTTGFNDDFKVNGQSMHSEIGIAIETQELPDIINHPEWGSIELNPGHTKVFKTVYETE